MDATSRRIVIGDIHGCEKALRTVLRAIGPQPQDHFVFLGDYIDRGPDSKGVVDLILKLRQRSRVTALRGNHEIMLLGVRAGMNDDVWVRCGGVATVASYGGSLAKLPEQHLRFFRSLQFYLETPDAIFVHAGYDPDVDMADQSEHKMFWEHLDTSNPPSPHHSGKRVFVGHTPQPRGRIWQSDHLVCLDTYCFGGGYLTAYETGTDEIWQASREGHLRRSLRRGFSNWRQQVWDRFSGLVSSPAEEQTPNNGTTTGPEITATENSPEVVVAEPSNPPAVSVGASAQNQPAQNLPESEKPAPIRPASGK
ncbi:MAG: metallophosphoesterase family protein [Planctomycetota bacterium]